MRGGAHAQIFSTLCLMHPGAVALPFFDPTDYSVVVKLRAPPPNPWRWEIYRAGRANAVEQAPVFFPTMAAASRAGKVALKQLLDGRAAARGSVLWGLRPPVGPIAKPN